MLQHTADTASGTLELERAHVNWMLSINEQTLPADVRAAGKRTFRSLSIDGEEFESAKDLQNCILYHISIYCLAKDFRLQKPEKQFSLYMKSGTGNETGIHVNV